MVSFLFALCDFFVSGKAGGKLTVISVQTSDLPTLSCECGYSPHTMAQAPATIPTADQVDETFPEDDG